MKMNTIFSGKSMVRVKIFSILYKVVAQNKPHNSVERSESSRQIFNFLILRHSSKLVFFFLRRSRIFSDIQMIGKLYNLLPLFSCVFFEFNDFSHRSKGKSMIYFHKQYYQRLFVFVFCLNREKNLTNFRNVMTDIIVYISPAQRYKHPDPLSVHKITQFIIFRF